MRSGPQRFVGKVYKYSILSILELQVPFDKYGMKPVFRRTYEAPEKAKRDRQTYTD